MSPTKQFFAVVLASIVSAQSAFAGCFETAVISSERRQSLIEKVDDDTPMFLTLAGLVGGLAVDSFVFDRIGPGVTMGALAAPTIFFGDSLISKSVNGEIEARIEGKAILEGAQSVLTNNSSFKKFVTDLQGGGVKLSETDIRVMVTDADRSFKLCKNNEMPKKSDIAQYIQKNEKNFNSSVSRVGDEGIAVPSTRITAGGSQ